MFKVIPVVGSGARVQTQAVWLQVGSLLLCVLSGTVRVPGNFSGVTEVDAR